LVTLMPIDAAASSSWRREPECEDDVEPDGLVGELQRRERPGVALRERGIRRRAQRAAGLVAQRDDDEAGDFRERERHQREIVADDLEAKARKADDQRDGDRRQDPGERAEPGRNAEVVPQHHHRVGADAEERAVPEAHHAQAPHDGPARIHIRPQQAHDDQVQRIVADAVERHRRQRRERQQGERLHRCFPPRMPCGRQNITAMKNTKAIT
jgi:hypothetical protein